MFSAPEMLSKASGCFWLLLAAPAARVTLKIQNSKFGRADARPNFEFWILRHRPARPGQHFRAPAAKFSRPGRENFVAGVRKCCGPGCYGAKGCAFTLFTHRYNVCTFKSAKINVFFFPRRATKHKALWFTKKSKMYFAHENNVYIFKSRHILHARLYSYLQGFWPTPGLQDFIKHSFMMKKHSRLFSLTKRSLKGSYRVSKGGAMLLAPVDSPTSGSLIPPFQSSLVKLPPISLD